MLGRGKRGSAELRSLAERGAGFLLLDSDRTHVSRTTAHRFLERLRLPAATFELLRANSLLAARGELLVDLVERWVPSLLRVLPSRALMTRRTWRGGVHGRLDVARTQALRLSGQADGFVTLARRRNLHLPENVFVCSALTPASVPKRFELACLVRLAMHIEARLTEDGPSRWHREHAIVSSDRKEVIRFRHDDGREVALFYDQAAVPVDPDNPGPREGGLRHYYGRRGSQRPDITLRVTGREGPPRYVVLEVKYSESGDYIASGYAEAIVYRHEYARHLTGWPKAVLVAPDDAVGELRRSDDVVAVGWGQLGDGVLLDGLMDGIRSMPTTG